AVLQLDLLQAAALVVAVEHLAVVGRDRHEHAAEGVALAGGREGLRVEQHRGGGRHRGNCTLAEKITPVRLGGFVVDELALLGGRLALEIEGYRGGYPGAVVDTIDAAGVVGGRRSGEQVAVDDAGEQFFRVAVDGDGAVDGAAGGVVREGEALVTTVPRAHRLAEGVEEVPASRRVAASFGRVVALI